MREQCTSIYNQLHLLSEKENVWNWRNFVENSSSVCAELIQENTLCSEDGLTFVFLGCRCCSVGGLGKDNSLACVSDVVAENINVQNALYGVRIKTWQVRVISMYKLK